MKKKLLSFLLVFALVVGIMPSATCPVDVKADSSYGSFVSGSQVISDMISHSGQNVHPRLIMSNEKFAELKKHIGEKKPNGEYTVTGELLDELLGEVYRHVNKDQPATYDASGEDHLLETSKKIQRRVAALALAYNIFGDEKYAKRCYQELEAACKFPDWSPKHFLDTAEMCTAFAYGYDWLYNWMNEDQRKLIRDNLIEKGLKQVMKDYKDESRERTYRWYQDPKGDNWKLVCTGGTNLAALAIGDEADAKTIAAQVIDYGYKEAYSFVRRAYDTVDGTYIEGLGYWDYATYYLGLQSSALISTTGTDYGLTDHEGIDKSVDFVRYMSSNTPKSFSFGDDGDGRDTGWAVFLWLGEHFDSPELSSLRLRKIKRGPGHDFNYLDVLWIDESKQTNLVNSKDTDWGAVGASNASFRNTWEESGIVAALHTGLNDYKYHGHFDLGSFYIESNGSRFFTDLGNELYDLENRKYSYRIKPEGHNTLSINPSNGTDQCDNVTCLITDYRGGDEAYAITDLTAAYSENDAESVIRGLKMIKDKECVIIQDDISLKKPGEIYWFAHTTGNISIANDGRSAIVTVGSDRLWVGIMSEGGKFTKMDAKPLSTSLQVANATSNSKYKKLAIHYTNTKDTTISVACIPLKEGETVPAWTPEFTALSDWSQEDEGIGEKLAGHSLTLDGSIGVNFYMELDDALLADEEAYMHFTLPNGTSQDVAVDQAVETDMGGKKYYVFKCHVAAKEMTDTITAQMFSGEEQGNIYEYTVKEYADYLFDNAYTDDGETVNNQSYADAYDLIDAMVSYGAYSQNYFGHNTDDLANDGRQNADISKVDADTVSRPYNSNTEVLPEEVIFEGSSLTLEAETKLNLFFTNKTGKTLTFTTDDNVTLTQEKSGAYIKVTITDIAAQHLGEDVKVNIAVSGDSNAYSVKYSPMNYCYTVLSKETTETRTEALKDVMRALYIYNQKAKAYFGRNK